MRQDVEEWHAEATYWKYQARLWQKRCLATEAERDAARRVLLSIAERLAAASEVIGRRAYRKEKCECIPKR